MGATGNSNQFNTATKKKDQTQIELDKVNEQIKKNEKMKNYKVEDKSIRKALDVKIISAETIESLIKYLNITETDNVHDMDKKLSASVAIGRKNTLADRKVTSKPIKEEKEEDDLERDNGQNEVKEEDDDDNIERK